MVSQRPESPPALSPQRSGELKRLRDAIESIVVAFILAFVFRAFIIEAFVIPTGSMAATLYGDHTTQTCPNCGYEYVSGWDARRRRPRRIVCPNCHTELLGVRPGRIERGDRILVFKFPFDLGGLGLGPRRWDVVVFKNPGDGRTNFIKRLIGMPNEVIEIIDGDIYVAPAETLSPAILEKLQQPPWDRQPLSPQQRSQLDRQLRIARKPASVQRSLWFVVYDQDYPPTKKYPGSGYPDWSSTRPGQSGWRRSPRELIFDGLERPFEDISFTGKDLRDFYAYNGQTGQPGKLVADLRLRAVLLAQDGAGYLQMQLGYRQHVFRLRLWLDGRVALERLRRVGPDRYLPVERKDLSLSSPPLERAVQVALANVDHQVIFEADGRRRLSMTYPADAARRRKQPPARQPPNVQLGAAHARLVLRHVVLERDIYYRSPMIEEPRDPETNRRNRRLIGAPGWGTTGHPIYLRPAEYFVLGDNSPESKDSRLWWHGCEYLEPALPLRKELTAQRRILEAGGLPEAGRLGQIERLLAELKRIIGALSGARRRQLEPLVQAVVGRCRDGYIPAARRDAGRALKALARTIKLLDRIDWQYYHLGTVPAEQLVGRAFFVYWPNGLAPAGLGWGIVPNVGRMRLIR